MLIKRLRRNKSKKGSAYLIALGVIGALIVIGIMMSKLTLSGRWSTIFASHDQKAEECAEAATNLAFRIVKENMNNYDSFYNFLKDPDELVKTWFMHFRLPAPVADVYVDAVSYENAANNGMDIQLDLFNSKLFPAIFKDGILYVYDTVSPDPKSPLSPLKGMFSALGGRVRVESTCKIVKAFGIIATKADYQIPGINAETQVVKGFLGNLVDKINGDKLSFRVDLIEFLPDKPLLKAPELSITDTYIVQGIPVPLKPIVQPILDNIFKKIQKELGLTVRKLAKKVFGDALEFELDFSAIQEKVKETITSALPDYFSFFKGDAAFDVTVEKQGFFEIRTKIQYSPYYPKDGPTIEKTLVMQREFRVADIQPVAPDHSFFIANSRLPYENKDLENKENWKGNKQIDFNKGMGFLAVHNIPGFDTLLKSLDGLAGLNLKKLCNEVKLPGRVRVNGTRPMRIFLGMFDTFPPKTKDDLRKMEIASLLLPHDDSSESPMPRPACIDKHPDGDLSHNVVPGFKSVMYNFWAKGEPFDWGYFSTADPGGMGTYWVPVLPVFRHTMLFGDFHVEFPFSLRVEGNLRKIYTHIKIMIVKIFIPPIPIIGFMGLDIPIPWLWATNHEEPYGFCKYPPYSSEDEAATLWDPDDPKNLPPNLYAPSQYLKKASYYYETSQEFQNDFDNRCIDYNGKKTFVCDGVTFVNDNLWLPEMHVMGRGMIVAAANIHLGGNVTKEEYDPNGNSTVFSLIARNGAVINNYQNIDVHACLFSDRGLRNTIGSKLKIYGNLVMNRYDSSQCQGEIDVYYHSNHCRSSLISMIKPIAKFDPTRYYVTFSSRLEKFEFLKK
jgi:hypothetical protein